MTENVRHKKIEKRNLHVIFLLILIFFSLNLIIGNSSSASSPPDAYLIEGVPMHQQITGVMCGPGALEMIFDFLGADLNQKAIADVARTSKDGTYTWDMVRTGHFSYLSTAMGTYFPNQVRETGFPKRPTGYASFNYSNDTIWWPELKALIASNIPVVLLMKWAPDDSTGHYRVIVGYDETKEVVYFMDPWGRSLKHITNPDGTVTWNMTDFVDAWNYSEYGTPHPYWGAIMIPWSVNLSTNGITSAGSKLNVTANITYPCPHPFDCTAYPASDSNAAIMLPSGMHLQNGQSQVTIGELQAGESVNVMWNVQLDANGAGSWIKVNGSGFVSGAVPEFKVKKVVYPAYNYKDNIGGEGRIKI